MKLPKRKQRHTPWIRCSHVTILPSGSRLYCDLKPRHEGVHEDTHMGVRITWGTKEPNKRWD